MLCYVMLCYVMLCYTILYCTVLYCTVLQLTRLYHRLLATPASAAAAEGAGDWPRPDPRWPDEPGLRRRRAAHGTADVKVAESEIAKILSYTLPSITSILLSLSLRLAPTRPPLHDEPGMGGTASGAGIAKSTLLSLSTILPSLSSNTKFKFKTPRARPGRRAERTASTIYYDIISYVIV